MGWSARERAWVVMGPSRRSTGPLRRPTQAFHGSALRSDASDVRRALRGATTLEEQTLPLVLVASFAALATVQLILTW
jgi:hypothetical protein